MRLLLTLGCAVYFFSSPVCIIATFNISCWRLNVLGATWTPGKTMLPFPQTLCFPTVKGSSVSCFASTDYFSQPYTVINRTAILQRLVVCIWAWHVSTEHRDESSRWASCSSPSFAMHAHMLHEAKHVLTDLPFSTFWSNLSWS